MFCAGAIVRLPWALGDPRGGPAWGTSVALSVALAGQRLDGYHRGEDEGKFQRCSDIVLSPLPCCVRDGPPPWPSQHTHTHWCHSCCDADNFHVTPISVCVQTAQRGSFWGAMSARTRPGAALTRCDEITLDADRGSRAKMSPKEAAA